MTSVSLDIVELDFVDTVADGVDWLLRRKWLVWM